MKLLVLLFTASIAVCAYARRECEPVQPVPQPEPEPMCPTCSQGQENGLTYVQWKTENWENSAVAAGTCPADSHPRIIVGEYLNEPQEGNRCCCEPDDSRNYPEVAVPVGSPE
ncbi:CLUMA_CG001740, isoform A [Clunio marinus]|uniref:CLUMA_CG001740, isoform A n=1 Tax=Clunio marinus TaxID=568069 RepID=A0A1J1HK86_9DIPT|nr:CLUMA_CG001740, isoform A [Clunio marinus]